LGGQGRRRLGHRLQHLPRPTAIARGEGSPVPAGGTPDHRHRDPRRRPAACRGARMTAQRDLLVKNAVIVDVITHTTYTGWFSVVGGRFAEVEIGAPDLVTENSAATVVDLGGA